jgi:biopolymer transport protein ExbB
MTIPVSWMATLLAMQDAGDPDASAGADAVQAADSMSLVDYIHAGGILSYILVCVSIVAVTLVVRAILLLRRSRQIPPEDAHRLDVLAREGDVRGAISYCDKPENDSFLTRVVGGALRRCSRSSFGMLELRSALEEAGQKELDRLYRLTDGIGMIASVGPMMGLLGTVVGMIGAFASMGTMEGAARSQALSGYMSIALVATAEGLIIAIPCTLLYSWFRRHIDVITHEAGEVIEDIAGHFQASGGANPESASPPSSAPPARAPAKPQAPRPAAAGGAERLA